MRRVVCLPLAATRRASCSCARQRSYSAQTQQAAATLLRVALVGAPNVGKSTLFNRLTRVHKHGRRRRRGRQAIVDKRPGITRDKREDVGRIAELCFTLIDTPGIENVPDKPKSRQTSQRRPTPQVSTDHGSLLRQAVASVTASTVAEADIVLLLFDAKSGLTALDNMFALWLLRGQTSRPDGSISPELIMVANKCEAAESGRGAGAAIVHASVTEAWQAGLGEPVAISAEHGTGLAELYTAMATAMVRARKARGDEMYWGTGAREAVEEAANKLAAHVGHAGGGPTLPTLAIVGRRNVGKSTLLNALVGKMRAVTGPLAGLTREPVESTIHIARGLEGQQDGIQQPPVSMQARIVDTAGLRREVEVHHEKWHVEGTVRQHTIAAIKSANVIALVVDVADLVKQREMMARDNRDADVGIAREDQRLVRLALDEGKAVILVFNKVDALSPALRNDTVKLKARLRAALPRWMAGGGNEVDDAVGMPSYAPVVVISALNGQNIDSVRQEFVQLYDRWNVQLQRGVLNRWLSQLQLLHPPPCAVRYMRQVTARPPTFAIFVGRRELPSTYLRFVENALRSEFGLGGVPIRIIQRTGKRDYLSA